MGGPGVDREPALASAPGHKFAVVDLEVEAEAAGHLVLPLQGHARGADDEGVLDALAQEQFLEDEAGLDGLAEADVVGDEEVGARELERLHQGSELVGGELDAGAEG